MFICTYIYYKCYVRLGLVEVLVVSRPSRSFAIYAGVGTLAIDPLIYLIMDDDRRVRRQGEYQRKVESDMIWLRSLRPEVWKMLSKTMHTDISPMLVMPTCLSIMDVSVGFVEKELWAPSQDPPWSLAD